jgi:hypothetical protein
MQIGGTTSRQAGTPNRLSKDLFGGFSKRLSNEYEAKDFSPLHRGGGLNVSFSLYWLQYLGST